MSMWKGRIVVPSVVAPAGRCLKQPSGLLTPWLVVGPAWRSRPRSEPVEDPGLQPWSRSGAERRSGAPVLRGKQALEDRPPSQGEGKSPAAARVTAAGAREL